MKLFEKFETFLNQAILRMTRAVTAAALKVIPEKVKNFFRSLGALYVAFKMKLRNFPSWALSFGKTKFTEAKTNLSSVDFKAKAAAYGGAIAEYKRKNQGSLKALLLPFVIAAQWFKGLTVAQSLLLLGFTGASLLAMIGMFFSGQKLMGSHLDQFRAPASVEVEENPRPVYYKKQTRFLELDNIRLPVFVPGLNELRAVDIDIVATTSNRQVKLDLIKNELLLRDHFILNVEPVTAAFPLEEEGKEIVRRKLLSEINIFIQEHKLEGAVTELEIIYILAN